MVSFISVLGWAGMAVILIAYLLVTTRQISPNSRVYQALNLIGAIGVLINSMVNDAWPSAVLFIVWGCLALIYLITSIKK
ncbi:MAG: CBU_0592 family membrane protein [Candidatus Pacearchaeota archaeon]